MSKEDIKLLYLEIRDRSIFWPYQPEISGVDQNLEVVKKLVIKDDIVLSNIKNNKRGILQDAIIYIQY